MDKELKKSLIDFIKKTTVKFAGKKDDPSTLTERQQKIAKALSRDFGGFQVQITKLISELENFDFSKFVHPTDGTYYSKIPAYCALVPLVPSEYEMDKIVLFAQDYSWTGPDYRQPPALAIKGDGSVGPQLNVRTTNLRAATSKEIDKLSDAQLEWLSERMIMIEKKGA